MPKIGGGGAVGDGAGNCNTALKELNGVENQQRRKDGNERRVKFKICQKKKNVNVQVKDIRRLGNHDDDGMASIATSLDRERPKPKRKPSKLVLNSFGWYKVKIFNGHIYEKSDLILALSDAMSPHEFEPQYWRVQWNSVIFFISDYEMAERIQQLGRNAQLPNGFSLLPRVSSGIPLVTIDDDIKLKMKSVMAKRYNEKTKALDLSRFHADPDTKPKFCPLFQENVMKAALDIICENIPDIVSLNLNENDITTLNTFESVESRLPHLRIIYLEDNLLLTLSHLWVFYKLPIVELVLRRNPCRSRYKRYRHFVEEVRENFPKLEKLNGEVLPLAEQVELPTVKATFFCNNAGAELINQFLNQYFSIFDSENRQLLLDAYHENAMLSISMPSANQVGRLKSFWKFNRNLFKSRKDHTELLKNGRLACVAVLDELPRTEHQRRSLTVDLTLYSTQLMVFTVTGLFKEFTNDDHQPFYFRHFVRTFVVAPQSGGLCIRNETIFLTNASRDQICAYKRSECQSTLASNPAPLDSNSLCNRLNELAVSSKAESVNNEDTKTQMIRAMSAQSQMNCEWSRKCLEETDWNFTHAAFVFDQLFKAQKIPPEAFAK